MTWRLWLILLIIIPISVVFAQDIPPAPPVIPEGQQMMDWARALGFPTWALVLIYVGNRMVATLQDFFKMLNRHVTQTERRLSRLEAVVFLHNPPGHFTRDDDAQE